MPLTTYLTDRDLVLDATRDESDVGGGMSWQQVRDDDTLPMKCRECGRDMHPRGGANRGKRPHFAHNKDSSRPTCPAESETREHRELKRRCAEWARRPGWHAALEVTSPTKDWRADVLATDPQSQRRVAFEIQLSPQTEEGARHRSRRYREAGIECVWIVKGHQRPWFRTHGALVVTGPTASAGSQERDWTVVDGCQRYIGTEEGGIWCPVTSVPLSQVVYSIARGQVVPSRRDPYLDSGEWWWIRADRRQHWTDPVAQPSKPPRRQPKRKPTSRDTRPRTQTARSTGALHARSSSPRTPATPSPTTAASVKTDPPPAPSPPEPPTTPTPEPPAVEHTKPQANPHKRVPTPPRDLTLRESLADALGGPWPARRYGSAAICALFLGLIAAAVSAGVTNAALTEFALWVAGTWGAVILLGVLISGVRRYR
ncbi:competence protein CoiA [Prauserella flava]|nr:competence protein CoiA [Prauserella flava]MCR3735889.1 competence protein CoiA [Prauserella salsuginis]